MREIKHRVCKSCGRSRVTLARALPLVGGVCWGVTAGKASHNASNSRDVTAGKMERNSSYTQLSNIFQRRHPFRAYSHGAAQ